MPTLTAAVTSAAAPTSAQPPAAASPSSAENWFNLDLYNQELQRRLQGVDPVNGRVFKSWDMFSDGIGNTANNFIKARPDLFGYDAALGSRQIGYDDNGENSITYNYWDFGALNDTLKNYEVRRLGQAGIKDGRRDVIVDKRTGEVVYAGMNPYSYDPAKTNLKDAVTFIGGALGGYGLVNGLAGLTTAASGSGGGATAAGAASASSPYSLAGSGASFGTSGAIGSTGAALGVPGSAASLGVAGGTGLGGLTATGAGLGIANAGAALGASGIGAGLGGSLGGGAGSAAGGLATLPAQATGAITPTVAQTLPMTTGVGAVPTLAGATGTSAIDKVLGAITTAGGNLVNKAIENPLQTAALVGSVGALAGAKPSGTPSFDAEAAAAAQGEANRDASWFDAVLNRPDMQTPWGSSTWTLREGADPKNPKPGDWVNTVALNAEQQGLLDAQNRLSAGYASTAEGMLGRVQDTYGQGLDLSGIPGMPDFSRAELDLSGLGAMPDFSQLGLDLSGLVDMPDFASLNTDNDRQRIEDALFARLEPLLQQEDERARTRLLNTGFEYGSEGSNIELDRLARGRNDARLAAILSAGDEASRLMGDQRSNMLAQLQARGQGLSEALAESGVDLQSLQGMLQTRGQGLDEARSSSDSILRAIMAQLQGRQQGFSEATYQRNLPLNELNAFRQGSQVQAPEFQSIIPTNTAASPELDALLAQLGVQQGNAANSQAGYNALLQAIAGLGSAWIGG